MTAPERTPLKEGEWGNRKQTCLLSSNKKQVCFVGGDDADRTRDLTDANRTLSQLSYTPT